MSVIGFLHAASPGRRCNQTVIASEAKQSSFVASIMDCFVAEVIIGPA
jgi:hypothetical protein